LRQAAGHAQALQAGSERVHRRAPVELLNTLNILSIEDNKINDILSTVQILLTPGGWSTLTSQTPNLQHRAPGE